MKQEYESQEDEKFYERSWDKTKLLLNLVQSELHRLLTRLDIIKGGLFLFSMGAFVRSESHEIHNFIGLSISLLGLILFIFYILSDVKTNQHDVLRAFKMLEEIHRHESGKWQDSIPNYQSAVKQSKIDRQKEIVTLSTLTVGLLLVII